MADDINVSSDGHLLKSDTPLELEKTHTWQKQMRLAQKKMLGDKEAAEKAVKEEKKLEARVNGQFFRNLTKKRKQIDEEIESEGTESRTETDEDAEARERYLAKLDEELANCHARGEDVALLLCEIAKAAAHHSEGKKHHMLPPRLQGIFGSEATLNDVFGRKRDFSKQVLELTERHLNKEQGA